MVRRLEEHHQTIIAGLDDIRRHCAASTPCSLELAVARERLVALSVARSRFVNEVVVPGMLNFADDRMRTELSELLFTIAAKRMVSNAHIKGWTSATIEEDWAGYCGAARMIWAMMEDQIEMERRYLIERLRERMN